MMGDTRYGYTLSDGKIWKFQIAAGTERTPYGRMISIGTYTGNSQSPQTMNFTSTPSQDFFTYGIPFAPTITLNGTPQKLNSDGTAFVPSDSSTGGNIGNGTQKPSGATREWKVEGGKLVIRDKWSDGSIANEYVVGTKNADGSFTITNAVGQSDLENFGIGSTTPITFNGVQGTIANGKFVPSTTNTTGTTGNTGTTGTTNDYSGVPGYSADLLNEINNGQGKTYLPVSGVTSDQLNTSFFNSWQEADLANKTRWNAAYKAAMDSYLQTMNDVSGLGNQQKIDLGQTYTNLAGSAQQNVAQRGLSGTTIKPTMQMGVTRQYGDAMNRLNEQLRRERLGYQTGATNTIMNVLQQRNDSYPDLTNYLMLKQGLGTK